MPPLSGAGGVSAVGASGSGSAAGGASAARPAAAGRSAAARFASARRGRRLGRSRLRGRRAAAPQPAPARSAAAAAGQWAAAAGWPPVTGGGGATGTARGAAVVAAPAAADSAGPADPAVAAAAAPARAAGAGNRAAAAADRVVLGKRRPRAQEAGSRDAKDQAPLARFASNPFNPARAAFQGGGTAQMGAKARLSTSSQWPGGQSRVPVRQIGHNARRWSVRRLVVRQPRRRAGGGSSAGAAPRDRRHRARSLRTARRARPTPPRSGCADLGRARLVAGSGCRKASARRRARSCGRRR